MSVRITPFLRAVFTADALFSAVAAVAFLLGSGFIAGLTGIPQPLLFWAGVILVPYAALLVIVGRRETAPRLVMIDIVAINLLWAAASLGLLATGAISPNALGIAFDIIQATAVAGFGALYAAGMRQEGRVEA